jgi:hypothetical protein
MIPTFIMFIFTQEITLLKGSPLYRSGVFMLWGWKLLFVYTESYCFLNSWNHYLIQGIIYNTYQTLLVIIKDVASPTMINTLTLIPGFGFL